MKANLSIRRLLVSGSAWAISGKALSILAAFATNALIARLVSVEEMGIYFLSLSIVATAALVAKLGMGKTGIRLIADSMAIGQQGRARSAIFHTAFFSSIGGTLVIAILTMGGWQWLSRDVFGSERMTSIVVLSGGWTFVLLMQGMVADSFRGFHKIHLATLFDGLLSGLIVALSLAYMLWSAGTSDIYHIVSVVVVIGLCVGSVGIMLLVPYVHRLDRTTDSLSSVTVLAIAIPLMITNLTSVLVTQADMWVLGMLRPQEDVALYGAAKRLAQLLAMPLFVLNSVAAPIVAALYARGEIKRLENTLRTTATIVGIPALVLFSIFLVYGHTILELTYGTSYGASVLLLIALAFGQLVSVWAGGCALALTMSGYQGVSMRITVITSTLTVAACIWGVREYGTIGVAIISALGLALQNIAMVLAAKLHLGVWTIMDFNLYRLFIRLRS